MENPRLYIESFLFACVSTAIILVSLNDVFVARFEAFERNVLINHLNGRLYVYSSKLNFNLTYTQRS